MFPSLELDSAFKKMLFSLCCPCGLSLAYMVSWEKIECIILYLQIVPNNLMRLRYCHELLGVGLNHTTPKLVKSEGVVSEYLITFSLPFSLFLQMWSVSIQIKAGPDLGLKIHTSVDVKK